MSPVSWKGSQCLDSPGKKELFLFADCGGGIRFIGVEGIYPVAQSSPLATSGTFLFYQTIALDPLNNISDPCYQLLVAPTLLSVCGFDRSRYLL